MARYTIDFTTNANKIVREIEDVNKKIAEVARTGKSVKITLDAAPLRASLDATFRQLDNQIAQMQRKLANLPIGSRKFQQQATALGITEGTRQRGGMQASAIQLGAQAEAFDIGSVQRLQRQLQAARIEASQISPNTSEWIAFQRQIGQINIQLRASERLAESIQMQESLGAFAPGSLNALEAKLVVLRNRAREISPSGETIKEWKALNQEILKTETAIEKQTKRPLTRGQRLGAAGGAFLYGGGLGGGVGSAVGGIAGGLAGGVPGAFTGAAIGQAVDNLGTLAFALNEQANSLKRLRLGLASASTSLEDFAEANEFVTGVSDRLLLPLNETLRQFTSLKASTVALGLDTKTTGEIFEGVSIAILKTGGSAQDVEGALRAVSQVFSKGKVSAEELRGQLGERLPGAVVKFAKANKISIQELDKAFESGQVSIDKFVTFARSLLKEGEGYSDSLATNQEFASARYAKAVEKLQLAVGKALGPTLNSIQSFAAEAINSILELSGVLEEFVKFLETRLGGGDAGNVFLGQGKQNIADRLIGGENQLRDVDKRINFYKTKIKEAESTLQQISSGEFRDNRTIFERFFGGPGEENLRKNLPNQIKLYTKFLKELTDARKLAEEKTTAGGAPLDGGADPNADRRAGSFLNAIEQREEALANARENYENEIASIRENAIKQAEALERRYQDQRLQDERELGRVRRELAASVEEEGLLRRGIGGEDSALLEQERRLGEAVRQYTEDKISREQEAQDRQIGLARELEDFKRQNAEAINKAGERYAKAIGKIQQDYAKSVAKLIEDGTGNGAKKLAAAGRLLAAEITRATQQQAFTAATGAAIIPRGQKFEVAGDLFDEQSLYAAADATNKAAGTAARAYVAATKEIQSAQAALNASVKTTAQPTTVSASTVSTADLQSSVEASQANLLKSLSLINQEKGALSEQVNIRNVLLKEFEQAAQANNANIKAIDDQNEAIEGQRQLIQSGVLPALAEAAIEREKSFDQERKLAQNAADALLSRIKDKDIQKEITQELENQLKRISSQEEVYERLQQTLRDNAALLEAAKIEAQTKNVGAGLFAGFINEAGVAYEEQIAKGVSPEVAASVARVTEQFTLAKTAADALQGSINGIGDAIGQVLTEGVAGLISGTATAKEVFASFLQSVAQALQQAAAQMIATYIAIGLAKIFAGLGSKGADPLEGVGGADWMKYTSAKGSYFDGPTAFFADGGIVSSPTFFQFADGGKINMGLMGEAGPEAIMPLKRGPDGRLGISMYDASRKAVANAESNAGISSIDYEDEASVGSSSSSGQALSSKTAQAALATRLQVMEQRSISEKRSELRQIQEMVAAPAKINVEYQSQVINNVEYVTRDQAERMASQSALRGRELALGALQNSVKARKRVGMG